MKSILFLIVVCFSGYANGQTPFLTRDSVNANLLNVSVLVHGDMWWNGVNESQSFYPNGTGKPFNFAGALWMSAYDNAGQLHVSAQTYRQRGNDFWPGMLGMDGISHGVLDRYNVEPWAKIWKVTRAEINEYLATPVHNIHNIPHSILTWPAKDNFYAQGKDGVYLHVTQDMAPFVDINGDGKYDAIEGDYPDVPGEQALWWAFTDNGPTHDETNGNLLRVDVHAMAYAYKRNTLIDQVVYFDYTIINRSVNDYHDMRVALWDDAMIGFDGEDALGFDSTWRMGIAYKSTNFEGIGPGHPLNAYGFNPPACAVTFVALPGDGGGHYEPAGSFMYYNDDPSVYGNPTSDAEYNNYMRSKIRDGRHLKYNADSPWVKYPVTGTDRNYAYSGDPSVPEEWHACVPWNVATDESNFVLSSNDFNLNAGERTKIVIALLVDTVFGGCPSLTGYDTLRHLADTAWRNYHATHVAVPEVRAVANGIKIYPNPAGDILHIDAGVGMKHISIYNTMGQRVCEMDCGAAVCKADISKYPAGVYALQCNRQGTRIHTTFIKH